MIDERLEQTALLQEFNTNLSPSVDKKAFIFSFHAGKYPSNSPQWAPNFI